MNDARFAKIIKSRKIPGIIVGPKEDALNFPELPLEELSVVMISQSFHSPRLDRVLTNFHASIHLAMEKIKSDPHPPVRLILPEKHDRNVQHAWSAYYLYESFRKRNYKSPIITQDPNEAVEWVAAHPGCTVLATNLVLMWLNDAGLSEKEHFNFVSLNVENRSDLTGVKEPGLAVGAVAADTVISRIQLNMTGSPENPHTTLLEPTWQVGEE